MTRSVEIQEAAVEAGARALGGHRFDGFAERSKTALRVESRAVVAAALPYLAPAEPQTLDREAVRAIFRGPNACGYWLENIMDDHEQEAATDAVMALARSEAEVKAEALREAAAAPAGDGGLREALDRLCKDHEAEAEGGEFTDIDTVWPSQIREVLDAHPAAPAVPQPVDREALRERIAAAIGRHGYDPNNQDPAQDATRCLCGVLVEEWDGHWADAVLAVLASEQEQD